MSSADYSRTTGNRAPEYGSTPQTDTATEARQGVNGTGNGVVLTISTAAVVLAFAIIYVAFFA